MARTLIFGLTLAGAAALTVASIAHTVEVRTKQMFDVRSGATYALVMHYRSDEFVLDTNLSMGDCYEALPQNQTAKHLNWACQLEQK